MQQASQLLRQAATGQVALAADVAQAVYSLAVGSGNDAAYDTVQQMYEQVGCRERRARGFCGAVSISCVLYGVSFALPVRDFCCCLGCCQHLTAMSLPMFALCLS
jgi:hypothetical protein